MRSPSQVSVDARFLPQRRRWRSCGNDAADAESCADLAALVQTCSSQDT